MLDNPQSQEGITKCKVYQIVHNHKKVLQKVKYVRLSIVSRKYYKKKRMLDSPQSHENIPKFK